VKLNEKEGGAAVWKGKRKGKYRIVEVTAKIENKGKLATHIERGAGLSMNRQDVVWLIGDYDKIKFLQGSAFQSVGTIDGTLPIPGYKASGARPQTSERASPPSMYPQRRSRRRRRSRYSSPQAKPQYGPKREVKWLIAVEGDTPLKVVVTSQKGGTKVKEISIPQERRLP
jgi:hypothetical protein